MLRARAADRLGRAEQRGEDRELLRRRRRVLVCTRRWWSMGRLSRVIAHRFVCCDAIGFVWTGRGATGARAASTSREYERSHRTNGGLWLVGWLVAWLVGWWVGWLVGLSVWCVGGRSVYFTETWKRREAVLQLEWGMSSFEDEQPDRPAFLAVASQKRSAADGASRSIDRFGQSRLAPRLASPRLASPRLVSLRLASSRLVSSHLVSPCLVTPRLVSSRLVSPRLASPRLVSFRLVSPRLVASCLVSSRRSSPRGLSTVECVPPTPTAPPDLLLL